jgi:hypothetical protein
MQICRTVRLLFQAGRQLNSKLERLEICGMGVCGQSAGDGRLSNWRCPIPLWIESAGMCWRV